MLALVNMDFLEPAYSAKRRCGAVAKGQGSELGCLSLNLVSTPGCATLDESLSFPVPLFHLSFVKHVGPGTRYLRTRYVSEYRSAGSVRPVRLRLSVAPLFQSLTRGLLMPSPPELHRNLNTPSGGARN